jgi:hypothetical protein
MSRLRLLGVTLLLSVWGTAVGTEGGDAAAQSPAQPETVEDILKADPEENDYGTHEKCIRSQRIVRTRVLSNRHILFEMPRSERWLVTLPLPCPQLYPGSKLAFERGGPRLCEFDDVRVLIETGMATARLGPTCRLANFESVTPAQVDALRQALRQQRKASGTSK